MTTLRNRATGPSFEFPSLAALGFDVLTASRNKSASSVAYSCQLSIAGSPSDIGKTPLFGVILSNAAMSSSTCFSSSMILLQDSICSSLSSIIRAAHDDNSCLIGGKA
jgi:hypothetical protein